MLFGYKLEFCVRACVCVQLVQAAEGKFNPHIHVEYEWSLRLEEMDESDDDLDDKVGFPVTHTYC